MIFKALIQFLNLSQQKCTRSNDTLFKPLTITKDLLIAHSKCFTSKSQQNIKLSYISIIFFNNGDLVQIYISQKDEKLESSGHNARI